MLESVARNWWVLFVRGIVAVILGVAVLIWPDVARSVLIYLWGGYAVVDGLFTLLLAFQVGPLYGNRWVLGLEGVAGVVAGVIAFIWPDITALALLYVVAIWAILTGILEFIAAIQLRKEITDEFWLGLSGILSVAFGGVLFLYPSDGLLSLMWLLGIYSVSYGLSTLFLSFRLRGAAPHGDKPQQMQPV